MDTACNRLMVNTDTEKDENIIVMFFNIIAFHGNSHMKETFVCKLLCLLAYT